MNSDPAVIVLLQSICDEQKDLKKVLKNHIETEPEEWAATLKVLMEDAFPAGDPDGHRRFHEASIKKAEDSAAFWHDMRKSAAKWGLAGFAFWALKTLIEAGALWIQNGAHLK